MTLAEDVLDAVEAALEDGESANDVAPRFARRADRAGVFRQFVGLLRSYDPGAAERYLLDYLLDRGRNSGAPGGPSGMVKLADVEPETVRWLWPGRIPLGKLTMLDGDPDTGKSTVALDLAARLSVGAPMPDGAAPEIDAPRGTVILTAEDGLADTVRPRLDAAGGDPDRVACRVTVPVEDAAGVDRLPTVEDAGAIRRDVDAMEAALVVVDPLSAFMPPDADTHRDADVRRALGALADLAERLDVAVLAIRHLNKSGGSHPLYRGGGSIAFIAAARAGLLAARDPADPDGPRRVLAPTKANLARRPPALAYRLETAPDDDHPRVAWEGETDHAAADLLDRATGHERTARDEAAEFLRVELSRGPRPVSELKDAAAGAGLSWRTVERAKTELGVESEKDGWDGPWRWTMPDASDVAIARASSVRDVAVFEGDDRDDAGGSGTEPKTDRSENRVADLVADLGEDRRRTCACGTPIPDDDARCADCKARVGDVYLRMPDNVEPFAKAGPTSPRTPSVDGDGGGGP